MKKIFILFVALMLLGSTTVYAQSRDAYVNQPLRFSIVWPEGWMTKQTDQFTFASGKPTNDPIKQSMMFLKVYSTDRPVKEIAQTEFDNTKKYDAKVKTVEEVHEISINGVKGMRCLFEQPITMKTKEGDVKYRPRILYVFLVKDDLLYHIGFSSFDFEEDYPKVEKALKSLKLLPAKGR